MFLSPFQATSVAELSPGEPDCLFALDEVEVGSQMAPSVSCWDAADLDPRAKAREASSCPWPDKELPFQRLYPGLSRWQGKGKSQIWEPRGSSVKAALIPLVWSGGRTEALASVYPQGSICKQTAEAR